MSPCPYWVTPPSCFLNWVESHKQTILPFKSNEHPSTLQAHASNGAWPERGVACVLLASELTMCVIKALLLHMRGAFN